MNENSGIPPCAVWREENDALVRPRQWNGDIVVRWSRILGTVTVPGPGAALLNREAQCDPGNPKRATGDHVMESKLH